VALLTGSSQLNVKQSALRDLYVYIHRQHRGNRQQVTDEQLAGYRWAL